MRPSRDGMELITTAAKAVERASEGQRENAQPGRDAEREAAREQAATRDHVLNSRRQADRARGCRDRLQLQSRSLERSLQTPRGEVGAMSRKVEVIPPVVEATPLPAREIRDGDEYEPARP